MTKSSASKPILLSLVLAICLQLSGCSSQPNAMIFAPVDARAPANVYLGQGYQVKVTDQRQQKHLLKIINDNGNAQHHPAANAVTSHLTNNLKNGFTVQGLAVNSYAQASISLAILQLESVVAQHDFKYEATASVEFKITITRNGHTFFKTFTGHTNREGVLRFDVAQLEQDLNQLVTTVLLNIFNDDYVRQSIYG